MEKVLFFELRDVCYNSYFYFERQLGAALKNAGYEVEYFRVGQDGSLADIERYVGQTYAAIIECNSNLPKLEMDDDSLYLNHLNGPFVDIILDHPLYHHDMLKRKIQNFHVICIDQNHVNYIQAHYPHIKSVHMLTMTGEEYHPLIPYEHRRLPLLFTGTYTPLAEIADAIEQCPLFVRNDTKRLIEIMLADYSLTIEAAVMKLSEESDDLILDNFPLQVQAFFLADTYLRSYLREKAVLALSDAGLPLVLCGAEWEKLILPAQHNVTLLPGVPYADSFRVMVNAKIVLNVMPLFKAGSHDRIFSAMLNHCVCLTDSSTYLAEQFSDGENICFFDSTKPDTLVDYAARLLSDDSLAMQIAQKGYQLASAQHTWVNRGADFTTIIKGLV